MISPITSGFRENAKYMFVGEALGAEEDQYRRPLVGISGQEYYNMIEESHWIPRGAAKEIVRNFHPYYNQELHRMSISNPNFLPLDKILDASSIFITNVCHVRPPNNEIDRFFATKTEAKRDRIPLVNGRYPKQPIQDGIEQLRRDIETIQPTIIIALGGTALWALTGLEGITKWRGSILRVEGGPVGNFGTKLIATFHPADILREWPHRFIAIRDLKRAYIERQWREVREKPKHYIIRPSYAETMEWLDEQSQPECIEEPLGADIETPWGWWNLTGHIACMGFATSRSDAICIPFMCVGDKEGYWPPDQELEVVLALRRLMTHRPLFFHKSVFDVMHIMRHWGFMPRLTDDTMVMQHVRFPGLFGAGKTDPVTGRVDKKGSSLSLAFCASMYCEHYRFWKCVKPDVEVLTKDGWKRLDSIENNVEIITSNIDGALNWEPVEVIVEHFRGNGVTINTREHKCWYTPNHKILHKPKWIGKNVTSYAGEMPSQTDLIAAGDYECGTVAFELIRILVMIQADGSIEQRDEIPRSVQFNFTKDRKIKRLHELCEREGIVVDEYPLGRLNRNRFEGRIYGNKVEKILGILGRRKQFGEWLLNFDAPTLDAFIDELTYWDGWEYGNSTYYSTVHKNNAEWVATIGHLRGQRCNVMEIHPTNDKDYYKVAIKPRHYHPINKSHIDTEFYDGSIYCVSTKSGFFLARSQGHIFITGNSDGKNWNTQEIQDENSWWIYNQDDCTNMYECYEVLRDALHKENLWTQYRFMMSLSGPVLDMMLRGFPLNQDLLKQFKTSVRCDIQDLQFWINEACSHEINTGSSVQLQKFFYDDLKVKKVMKGRGRDARPTLNEGALEIIARRYPSLGPLCYAMKDERSLSHFDENMLSVRLSEDGCAETEISITGTETMRFTSTKSCFGTGLNLQNLNRMPEE